MGIRVPLPPPGGWGSRPTVRSLVTSYSLAYPSAGSSCGVWENHEGNIKQVSAHLPQGGLRQVPLPMLCLGMIRGASPHTSSSGRAGLSSAPWLQSLLPRGGGVYRGGHPVHGRNCDRPHSRSSKMYLIESPGSSYGRIVRACGRLPHPAYPKAPYSNSPDFPPPLG